MKPLAVLCRLALVSVALPSPVVFAHPGHEGGHGDGLTWDFAGAVVHFLTSPYHVFPALALGVIGAAGLMLLKRSHKRPDGKE